MFNKSILLSLISILIGTDFVTALYFHIGETERKCFIEEIPDETNVIGKKNYFLVFLCQTIYFYF